METSPRYLSKLVPPGNRARVRATPRAFLACLLSLSTFFSLGIEIPAAAATEKKPKQDPVLKGLPITDLTADEAILHALNRLAYGPRPGDVERIKQIGLAKWIDQQLNPNSINDAAVEARLDIYPTLRMHTSQLLAEYPNPKQAAKQELKAQNQNANQQAGADAGINAMAQEMDTSSPVTKTADTSGATMPVSNADTPSPMKLNPATRGPSQRDPLGMDPNAVPRAISDDSKRPQRVVEELAMAKTLRAVYSERQLQQVMDDFWFNHFNVFAGKGEVKWYLTSYERDVIQPHALGKFRDLVEATAKSPAMLFYLDDFLSADPRARERIAQERAQRQQARRGRFGYPPPPPRPQQNQKKQERGLNENYGRELMELHTLGVDGGYTQKDVTEVARCFTGWSIEK